MATAPVSVFARSNLSAIRRRAAPWVAFGLLLIVGIMVGLTYQVQGEYGHLLSSAVWARWAEGGAGPLAQAALLLALWLVWRVGRKVVLFGAFFLVERRLPGRTLDKQKARFAFNVQIATALLYAGGATAVLVLAPFPSLPDPVLNLDQAGAAPLLGPFAPLAVALLALFAYDFIEYWVHRAQHHFAFLWRFHAVHHSLEELDSLNSYSHPVDTFMSFAAITLLSLWVGFDFEMMLWFLGFRMIHDRLLHTSAPINFGPLGAVVVDNRTHFLHHTRVEARSGKNFAGTFTIFDRLFGTYERPEPGALAETGLQDRGEPPSVTDFFIARLAKRRPSPAAAETITVQTPDGGCRPSA